MVRANTRLGQYAGFCSRRMLRAHTMSDHTCLAKYNLAKVPAHAIKNRHLSDGKII